MNYIIFNVIENRICKFCFCFNNAGVTVSRNSGTSFLLVDYEQRLHVVIFNLSPLSRKHLLTKKFEIDTMSLF